eukprot:CAMPEP_0194543626 /NCGR_PEP_ID=MMETSP0253-20130528/86120_1 /TAXON_ID=2966 /ORGANISM="Noctiluca scintillans" /LENGTH=102 /DNA_ID=CAMNT_0039390411 /DNA_START=15 /DNA_END=323 /DNA_ORIENTATION=-
MVDASNHTILLVQFDQTKDSRSYVDYETLAGALDGVCQMYRQSLKSRTMSSADESPDALVNFLDGLGDISCLVFNPTSNSYVPHNLKWIRAKIVDYLEKMQS